MEINLITGMLTLAMGIPTCGVIHNAYLAFLDNDWRWCFAYFSGALFGLSITAIFLNMFLASLGGGQ